MQWASRWSMAFNWVSIRAHTRRLGAGHAWYFICHEDQQLTDAIFPLDTSICTLNNTVSV